MTLDPLENLDLSELPDYDAEAEYQALLRSLRRQAGFGIIFVRCSPDQGRKLIEQVTQDLPQQRCGVISLTEPLLDGDFFSRAQQFLTEHPADVVFVEGLEHSLLDYEETKRQSGWTPAESRSYSWKGVPPILRNLNQQRDRFRNELPAQFVFLVSPFTVKYLRRRSPDFFDWQSGVFDFKDPQEALVEQAKEYFLEDSEKVREMSPSERVRQVIRIRELLDEPTLSSDESFRLLYNLGIIQDVNGSPQDARLSREKALEISILTGQNFFYKGNILADTGRHEEATTSYDKVLEIKPNYHQAWNNRGIALANLGRHEEAITSYDKALEIKPDKNEAWYNRGNSLANLGRYEEAIASYDKAVEIKPDKDTAWNNRGVSLNNLGRYEEAIASYGKALEVNPNMPEAWNNQGNSLNKLGRHEEAIASYDKALKIKPNYQDAWYNRGNSLKNLDRHEEAIINYENALEIKSDMHEYWNNRGSSLYDLGRYEEAIASYDKALEIKPNYQDTWYNRGISLCKLGRYKEAIASYDKVLKLKPDDQKAKYSRRIALIFERLSLPLNFVKARLRKWFIGGQLIR